MTVELDGMLRRKENLRRARNRYPLSVIHQARYDDICARITNLKRMTKIRHYEAKLGSKVSIRQRWNNLNDILGRKRKTGPQRVKAADGRTGFVSRLAQDCKGHSCF